MQTAHRSSHAGYESFRMGELDWHVGSVAAAGKESGVAHRRWRSMKVALSRYAVTTASVDAHASQTHRTPVRPGCSAGIRARALLASRPASRVSARLPPSALPSMETLPSAPSPLANAAISTHASLGRYALPATIRSGPPSSSRDVWCRVPLRNHAQRGSSVTTANAPRHVTSMPASARQACSVPRPCPKEPWRVAGRSRTGPDGGGYWPGSHGWAVPTKRIASLVAHSGPKLCANGVTWRSLQ